MNTFNASFVTLSVLSASLALGCMGTTDPLNDPSASNTAALLEQPNGGMSTADEVPQFADNSFTTLPAMTPAVGTDTVLDESGSFALDPPPTPSVPERADALLASAAGDHPRLRSLDDAARRWRDEARASRRMLWPDLDLSASYGFRETLLGRVEQDDMWNASVSFMLPVFARSRELATGREMDAMAFAADAERLQAALALARDVTAAHAEARAAARTAALLADTVVAAQRLALTSAWSAYAAGQLDLAQVLDSAHSLYAEEQSRIRADQDLARAAGRLVALTGRPDLVGLDLPRVREEGTR